MPGGQGPAAACLTRAGCGSEVPVAAGPSSSPRPETGPSHHGLQDTARSGDGRGPRQTVVVVGAEEVGGSMRLEARRGEGEEQETWAGGQRPRGRQEAEGALIWVWESSREKAPPRVATPREGHGLSPAAGAGLSPAAGPGPSGTTWHC